MKILKMLNKINTKQLDILTKLLASLQIVLNDVLFMKNKRLYSKACKRNILLIPIILKYMLLQLTYLFLDYVYESELDIDKQTEFSNAYEPMINTIVLEIKQLLILKDPQDDSTEIIVLIRSGTGGDLGALFAFDIYRMYLMYASKNNWTIVVNDINDFSTQNNQPAIKKIIFTLSGIDVYKKMKYESGIHRVIRNPITDGGDRTHTSSATVAVLPVISLLLYLLDMNELRIDFYRGTGKGGQHRNTTDSACRILHLPTNIMVTCLDERAQPQNKLKALTLLRTRLYNLKLALQLKLISEKRRLLVGRGNWSNRIRTYNFKKQMFYDHRIDYTTTKIYEIMNGDLDLLVNNLLKEYIKEFTSGN